MKFAINAKCAITFGTDFNFTKITTQVYFMLFMVFSTILQTSSLETTNDAEVMMRRSIEEMLEPHHCNTQQRRFCKSIEMGNGKMKFCVCQHVVFLKHACKTVYKIC